MSWCLVSCVVFARLLVFLFFFNDTATTEIYTLSLHDALPISPHTFTVTFTKDLGNGSFVAARSEEHTSELQSHDNLVCRLLLEKKNTTAPARFRPRHLLPTRRSARDNQLCPPARAAERARRGCVWPYQCRVLSGVFFFNDPAPPEKPLLSLPEVPPI